MQEHACRSEGVDLARELDYKSAAAWVGHPYFDVIDNSTDFETKMNRMLECVCQKLGIDTGDRLLRTSRKLKFLGESLTMEKIQFCMASCCVFLWLILPDPSHLNVSLISTLIYIHCVHVFIQPNVFFRLNGQTFFMLFEKQEEKYHLQQVQCCSRSNIWFMAWQ